MSATSAILTSFKLLLLKSYFLHTSSTLNFLSFCISINFLYLSSNSQGYNGIVGIGDARSNFGDAPSLLFDCKYTFCDGVSCLVGWLVLSKVYKTVPLFVTTKMN